MEEQKKSWTASLFAYARGEETQLLASVVLSVVSIIALLCIDWRLALASLVTFPLSVFSMGLTFKISGKNFDKYDHAANYMNSTIFPTPETKRTRCCTALT